jgi:hypothetical protein
LTSSTSTPPVPSSTCFCHAAGVGVTALEEGQRVLETATEVVILNPLGAIIWDLLDGETNLESVVEALTEHFSTVPPATIEHDVQSLVSELLARDLIEV